MAAQGENGWQSERTLAQSIRYMFDNEISTDVCFEVGPKDGDTVTFRAHKFILISRSEVFEAMFSSGMTECRSGREARVRVEDIDPDVFKEVLNYMYFESASVGPESAVDLMYAAKKYMLPKLVRECCNCLLKSLDVNNVLQILEHSLYLDDQQLQTDCLKVISTNARDLLTGTEIVSSSRQVMAAILKADTIPLSEPIIYETALNWAKHRLQSAMPAENPTDLQIRYTLGDLLNKIRFPVMKTTEFAEISEGTSVLTAEEKDSIYYFLATKKIGCQLKFPTDRRVGEEVWIDRTVNCITIQWHSAPNVDAINFATDHDILLTGIGLYTGYNGTGYDVDVEILQSVNSLFKKRVTVPYTGVTDPFKILLDEPIIIPAGVIYSVKALSNDSIGHYGQLCQAVCVKETVTFMFYMHAESLHTNEMFGQIPRLYFCNVYSYNGTISSLTKMRLTRGGN